MSLTSTNLVDSISNLLQIFLFFLIVIASTTNTINHNNSLSLVNNYANDDGSCPYYIHHLDNPGLVLVSQPLTGDNYALWSRAMVIALFVKNKVGFIDGSLAKPKDSDEQLNNWVCNNNIVISWI